VAALWLVACATPGPIDGPASARDTRDCGGLEVTLAVRGPDGAEAQAALDAGFAEAERLAAILLAERPGSEIDILNHVPMRVSIALSPETAAALAEALDLADRSESAYDPTAAAPLRRLWGLEEGAPRVPRDFEIQMALRAVDWTDIEMDESGTSASRYSRSTRVDLGPLAVGAVLDGALAALDAAGAQAALARARGVTAAFGAGTEPWALHLEPPSGHAVVHLADGAVATAGRGPVHATPDGETIREPFDPRSGRPAGEGEWVVVRAPTAARAGGAALAGLVLGGDAPDWWASQPGLEGAVVLGGGRRLASPGAGVRFAD
jgi:thiamine biosynthesis lipoprotein